jgi:hypothetical protein
MRSPAVAEKPADKIAWPHSPTVLFGIAASFFVLMGAGFIRTGVLNPRLPILQHGQITQVTAGHLVLVVATPFAIFALIYGGIEFGASLVFHESATRIHLACTVLAVLEAIRVYMAWAVTTANRIPDTITRNSFGGAISFLVLAGGAFVWNLCTSKRNFAPTR